MDQRNESNSVARLISGRVRQATRENVLELWEQVQEAAKQKRQAWRLPKEDSSEHKFAHIDVQGLHQRLIVDNEEIAVGPIDLRDESTEEFTDRPRRSLSISQMAFSKALAVFAFPSRRSH